MGEQLAGRERLIYEFCLRIIGVGVGFYYNPLRPQFRQFRFGLADGLDVAALDRVLDYHSFTSGRQRSPLRWVLTHLFNHHTVARCTTC